MNVLIQGLPFSLPQKDLPKRFGKYEVRWLGVTGDVDYRFDPVQDTFPGLLTRIRKEWRPDVALFCSPADYPPPLEVEEADIFTVVAGIGDWDVQGAKNRWNLGRYDVVMGDKASTIALKCEGVAPRYLFSFYAQNPVVHRRQDVAKDLDIVFAGRFHGGRFHLRDRILERVAKLSHRWRIHYAADVYGEAYARLYNRARIVINRSMRSEANMRLFETAACNALPFIEEENLEVRDHFKAGEEVVLYNEENLEELLDYHLSRPDLIASMTAKAHARSREFTAENRLEPFIDWAVAQPGSGRPFRRLPPEEKLYQSVLLYSGSANADCVRAEWALLNRLAKTSPGDPRTWTGISDYYRARARETGPHSAEAENALKTAWKAAAMAPESVVFAMNTAQACLPFPTAQDKEMQALYAALENSSIEHAPLLFGEYWDPSWSRWQRAAVEDRPALEMIHAMAHIQLAKILETRGDLIDAEGHLEKAHELDPRNFTCIKPRANILANTGRKAAAADLLLGHLEDLPIDWELRLHLAGMLKELGRIRESEKVLAETECILRAFAPLA